LETHANFEAIIDGANIALYQQNFADGGFSLSQVHALFSFLGLPVFELLKLLYAIIDVLLHSIFLNRAARYCCKRTL